jgi:hypothetical protein
MFGISLFCAKKRRFCKFPAFRSIEKIELFFDVSKLSKTFLWAGYTSHTDPLVVEVER